VDDFCDADFQEIVDLVFPFPLPVLYELTCTDDAPYSIRHYHTFRGDTELQASVWREKTTHAEVNIKQIYRHSVG
jgi:hypothetical protein